MTKGTKIYFFVVLGIIIVCFAAGCFVRISFTGYGTFEEMEQAESLEDYRIQLRGSEEGSFSDLDTVCFSFGSILLSCT